MRQKSLAKSKLALMKGRNTRGQFARKGEENKPTKKAGRKKGSKNKINADVKAMVMKAIDKRGGHKLFMKFIDEHPEAFMQHIVSRILTREVNVTGGLDNTEQLTVRIGVARSKLAKLLQRDNSEEAEERIVDADFERLVGQGEECPKLTE